MFLAGKAVLHIMNTATIFLAEPFLGSNASSFGHSVQRIWSAFFMICGLVFSEYPNRLCTDQRPAFTSEG